jgi:hypothetical protein
VRSPVDPPSPQIADEPEHQAEPSGQPAPAAAVSDVPAPSWIDEHRYLCLSAVVVLLLTIFTLKGRWAMGVDIWEHAAAIRELSLHPLHPQHPFYAVDASHQFFNPYSLVLALVSRITGVGVPTVLNVAGIANVVLLLVGLHLFVTRISRRRHVDFYTLLLVLVLWGPGAWFFSGFLHWDVLPIVMTYPSTFAKGVSLIALWLYQRHLDERDRRLLVIIVALLTVTLLSHPVDALAAYIGLVALSFRHDDQRVDRTVALALAIAATSFLVAFLWPYFSLYGLLFGHAQAHYRESIGGADHDMYVHVLSRIFPMLIVVPFFVRRLWRDWRDPLALYLTGLVLLYAYGYAVKNWSYGRLVSSIMFIAAILLAEELVMAAEAASRAGDAARPALRWVQVTTVGLLVLGTYNVRNGFVVLPDPIARRFPYSWVHSNVDMAKLSQFDFLTRLTTRSDVVLSDVYTSLSIPTFSGRTVAVARTQAFVDADQRGTDLGTFFNPATPEPTRRGILRKYKVGFVLLLRERLAAEPATYVPLQSLGRTVHTNARFVLVDVRGR